MTTSTRKLPRVVAITARAGIGLGALVVASALFAVLANNKPEAKTIDEDRPSTLVRVVTATPTQVTRVWQGFGTTRAMDTADISAQVSARVIERDVSIEPGVRVNAGDLIIRLDPVDFEQRVESATQLIAAYNADLDALNVEQTRLNEQIELAGEELAVRQREYDRVVGALEEGAGNMTEVEVRLAVVQRAQRELVALKQQADLIPPRRARISAQLASAHADLRLAEEDLARTEIRSPIAGTIQRVTPQVGELLIIGEEVARIVNLDRLEIPLRLPASCVDDIAPGAPVMLRPDGPAPSEWRGNIARIAPESDPATRMVTVFVEVRQSSGAFDGALMPGRFVVGAVESATASTRVIVPRGAIRKGRIAIADQSDDGYLVNYANVDIAFFVNGPHDDIDPDESQWAVIEAGVEPGQQVILTARDIAPGQPIRIQETVGAPSTAAQNTTGGE